MNRTITGESEPQEVYALIFGFLMALGLPLNAVSLWVLVRRHSLKSPNAVFMVNLALSDLLLVISLPMRVYYFATGTWPLSSIACLLITLLFRDNIRTSSVFITFISVDRLLAVVYPLRSRGLRTSCNAWKAVILAWLLVLVMNIPEVVRFVGRSDKDAVPTCFSSKLSNNSTKFSMIYYQPVLVLSMLSVNIVCTAMVFWTLCNHRSDSARINNKVKVMLIFVLNLVMFIVCFVPVSVSLLLSKAPNIMPLVCLATVNCCLDPLLYYFSFDGFWKKKEDVDMARESYTMEAKSDFIHIQRPKGTLDPPSVRCPPP